MVLDSNRERGQVSFHAQFAPLINFPVVLSAAAVAVQRLIDAPHWGAGQAAYLLRDLPNRTIVIIDYRRVLFQSLGLGVWLDNQDRFAKAMSAALEKLEVDLLKEVTVGITVYLPLGALNHAEMCELMFGSYLLPAEEFRAICGQPEDALVQLHGTKADAKFKLIAAPMTASQAVQSFLENAALEQFVEPKLLDTTVKTFKEGLERDALFLDMSFTKSEAPRASLPLFLREALREADTTAEACVRRLRSLEEKVRH